MVFFSDAFLEIQSKYTKLQLWHNWVGGMVFLYNTLEGPQYWHVTHKIKSPKWDIYQTFFLIVDPSNI
jgi:hypothetical protein